MRRSRARVARRVGLLALAALLLWGGARLAGMLGSGLARGSVAGVPLVELGARGGGGPGDLWVLVLSGDGGWTPSDRRILRQLAARGVPVVGWNSLRYYWRRRVPQAASRDLARVMAHYSRRWRRPRVALVGYSFGADVLPFLVTRLPPALRARIAGVTLLGFAPEAGFEVYPAAWVGWNLGPQRRTAPEVKRMLAQGMPVLCVNGVAEPELGCPELPGDTARVVLVPTGHHFRHWYRRISEWVLHRLRPAPRAAQR